MPPVQAETLARLQLSACQEQSTHPLSHGGSAHVRRIALVMEEHKALGPWHIRLCLSDTQVFET
jgi:hypothetical protein